MTNQSKNQQPDIQTLELSNAVWDLRAVLLINIVLFPLVLFDPSNWLIGIPRFLCGFLFTLWIPGYCLTLVLFPRRYDLDVVIRLALSFGSSAAMLPPLAMVVSRLGWPIRPFPLLCVLSAVVLVLCTIALWRRYQFDDPLAYEPRPIQVPGWWTALRIDAKIGIIGGGMLLILIAITIIWLVIVPSFTTNLTEFYILGAEGLAEDYPREAMVNEEIQVTLGVANRENRRRLYWVEIWVSEVWNPDRRVLVRRTDIFRVIPGDVREYPFTWSMPWVGEEQKVEILLFVEGRSTPYRRLHLYLDQVYAAEEE